MHCDICTIPVAEMFEPRDGCPICRMRQMLDDRMTEYITGAAMMEPDVRKSTNEKGFCNRHYQMMLARRNRLSVALMLESHLAELQKKVSSVLSRGNKTGACFVCEQVDANMAALIGNTLKLYEDDRDFRQLFSEQPAICLPHFTMLTEAADKRMGRRFRGELKKAAEKIVLQNLEELKSDVKHFCDMFDYRNNTEEADWGNSRDAIERAVEFLTSFPAGK